ADPNGAILRVRYDDPRLEAATTVVAAGEDGIQGLLVAGRRLYVHDVVGGPSQVRLFTTEGRALGTLPMRPVNSVSGLAQGAGDGAWIEMQGYTEPPHWMHYAAATGALAETRLAMRSPADFSDVTVRREFAVSKDGTRVPLNILMRRGVKLDGHA